MWKKLSRIARVFLLAMLLWSVCATALAIDPMLPPSEIEGGYSLQVNFTTGGQPLEVANGVPMRVYKVATMVDAFAEFAYTDDFAPMASQIDLNEQTTESWKDAVPVLAKFAEENGLTPYQERVVQTVQGREQLPAQELGFRSVLPPGEGAAPPAPVDAPGPDIGGQQIPLLPGEDAEAAAGDLQQRPGGISSGNAGQGSGEQTADAVAGQLPPLAAEIRDMMTPEGRQQGLGAGGFPGQGNGHPVPGNPLCMPGAEREHHLRGLGGGMGGGEKGEGGSRIGREADILP